MCLGLSLPRAQSVQEHQATQGPFPPHIRGVLTQSLAKQCSCSCLGAGEVDGWAAEDPLLLFACSTADLCICWYQQDPLCLMARLIE